MVTAKIPSIVCVFLAALSKTVVAAWIRKWSLPLQPCLNPGFSTRVITTRVKDCCEVVQDVSVFAVGAVMHCMSCHNGLHQVLEPGADLNISTTPLHKSLLCTVRWQALVQPICSRAQGLTVIT